MKIHYQHDRLLQCNIFAGDDLDELHALAAKNPLSELICNARWKEESAIDFVFTSAQIEGNSYSRADTIALLKLGKTANDKRFTDALMIINLRAAYDYILDHPSLVLENPIQEMRKYHSILMRGILAESELGEVRKTHGTMIGGSQYVPLSGSQALKKEMAFLVEKIKEIENPFDKAVYAYSNVSYLQYFEDGNKRTSRIFQNAILMAHNISPVLFQIDSIQDYLDATLCYYEQGDIIMNRAFLLECYRNSYSENNNFESHPHK